MAMELDRIVPWGRTGDEYQAMFQLTPAELQGRVLDGGGGPSSFTASVHASGGRATAIDPLYAFEGPAIRDRFEVTAPLVLAQVRATPNDWTWGYHRDLDALLASRRAALEAFLADYPAGRAAGRYVDAALPSLPFPDGSFDLALSSHLLFLYSDLLPAAFHVDSVRELGRVAREVRIFPLLTLRRDRSPHLEPVRAALAADGWSSEIVRVDYELQRGGNEMLRIFRARP